MAAIFSKVTIDSKDWIDIQLFTSIVHQVSGPIGGSSGVYAALGISRDDKMGDDSVVDCVYTPNATDSNRVIGELSYNHPKTDTEGPYNLALDDATNNDKSKIVVTTAVAVDNVLYCRVLRAVKPNDLMIFDANAKYYLLMTRGPSQPKPGVPHNVVRHHGGNDPCSDPIMSSDTFSLSGPYGTITATETALPMDACKNIAETTAAGTTQAGTTTPSGSDKTTTPFHLATLMFTVIGLAACLL